MKWFQAFFVGIWVFIISFFHPHTQFQSNAKVIFQVAPSTTPSASNSPSPSPTLFPSVTPFFLSDLSSFIYPGSMQTGSSSVSLSLQTTDDANTVSTWYQRRVSSLHLQITSVVESNSNNTSIDVITCYTDSQNIKIQITRKPTDSYTYITVISTARSSNTVSNSI